MVEIKTDYVSWKTPHSRDWLIGLSALDWPVKKVFQLLSLLETGQVTENNLRVELLSLAEILSLTIYQFKSILNFITEYNFTSFKTWLDAQQIRVQTKFDSDYPAELKQLSSAPLVLWSRGKYPVRQNMIAVIGSRHPSLLGVAKTEELVSKLVKLEFGIISGFMYGADQTAQQQAIKLGGYSLGVLGYGLNQVYPASYFTLMKNFQQQGGSLISEFPPWAKPQKWRFLKRNLLVASLAKAVIVTEAAVGSGSHSTVKAARILNKPVGVLPCSSASPFYAGAQVLLAEGVESVTSIHEFLATI